MRIPDGHGNEFVYKPTQFLTNSPLVAARLERKCDKTHKHAQLQGNRPKQAAIYPNKLIDAVTKGINDQIKADTQDLNLIASIEIEKGYNILDELKQIQLNAAQCHEEYQYEEYAEDDVSGAYLDPKMVRNARKDEIDYVRSMKLYTKVPISECLAKTGKQPIAVRWIDVNKQDAANPLYRSRLVGKEFKTYDDMSLYAATPPIEALRLILHQAATNRQNEQFKIMTNDVSRAYFYAPIQEGQHIYVKLPEEDILPGEEQMCGKLNYSMYGTRRAATNWQTHYTKVLVQNGFVT